MTGVLGFFKSAVNNSVRVTDIEPLPVVVVGNATAVASNSKAGVSSNGSAGVASAQAVAAGTYVNNLTIQNTRATQILYFSFTNPATVSDVKLAAGASITLPFGPTNALFAIGSAAATTYALVGA